MCLIRMSAAMSRSVAAGSADVLALEPPEGGPTHGKYILLHHTLDREIMIMDGEHTAVSLNLLFRIN